MVMMLTGFFQNIYFCNKDDFFAGFNRDKDKDKDKKRQRHRQKDKDKDF